MRMGAFLAVIAAGSIVATRPDLPQVRGAAGGGPRGRAPGALGVPGLGAQSLDSEPASSPKTGAPRGEAGFPVERSRLCMGTQATVRIDALREADVTEGPFGPSGDRGPRSGPAGLNAAGDSVVSAKERAGSLAEGALDILDAIDRVASLYKPESDLVRLNVQGFPGPCPVPRALGELLQASVRLARATGGAFDPTIKPLMDHLGFYRELGSTEDPGGLAGALDRVGWRGIAYRERRGAARFRKPGMAVDLGGVAKGYALDRAGAYLAGRGVQRAEIELGRSYLLIGRGQGAAEARFELAVAVTDPGGDETVRAVVRVPEGSVATSSPWTQTRPGAKGPTVHIVDPRRGALETAVLGATVWAPTGTDADAIATALVVAGPAGLKRFARRLQFEALVFVAAGEGHSSRRASEGGRPGQGILVGVNVRAIATRGLEWRPLTAKNDQIGSAGWKTGPREPADEIAAEPTGACRNRR